MNGAQILVECLKRERVNTLFCYPGAVIIPIYDELYLNPSGIRLVQPRHEQWGTIAADGYARSTGTPGVVLVTSGPGATNTVTGLANAFLDSIPLVVISGQVPGANIGTDAFQEANITGISMPITKDNILVSDVRDLSYSLKRAFIIAQSGRPGPVLVDIPKNVLVANSTFVYPETLENTPNKLNTHGSPKQIKRALKLISVSKRPLILAGGGVHFSGSLPYVNEFADKYDIPVVHTLMGNGINPKKCELRVTKQKEWAIRNCDLLIALGTRFNDDSPANSENISTETKIIHVDVDPAEIGKVLTPDVPIVGDLKSVLIHFLSAKEQILIHTDWIKELQSAPSCCLSNSSRTDVQITNELARSICRYFDKNTIVVTDLFISKPMLLELMDAISPRKLFCSSGLGTPGYALAAGIGAKLGNPETEVLVLTDQNSLQASMQELLTVRREEVHLKIMVFDHSHFETKDVLSRSDNTKKTNNGIANLSVNFAEFATALGMNSQITHCATQIEDVIGALASSSEAMLAQLTNADSDNQIHISENQLNTRSSLAG